MVPFLYNFHLVQNASMNFKDIWNNNLIIGAFQIHLRIPLAHSLKDKRSYLKGTIQRLGRKFNISISEIDNQDNWHEATVGIACVSNEKSIIESTFRKVLDEIELVDGIELEAYEEEYL